MFFGIKIADLDFMRDERVDLERINRFQNLESLCLLNVGSSVGSFGKDKLGSLQSFEMYDWKELKDLSFLAGAGAALTKYTVDSCPQLQSLEGMEHLTKLKELTIFNCAELKEISAVRHLESLEELNLALLPSLTDLSALYSLKRLALVRISRDTPVSAKDLRALKKELPKCKIEAC